MLICHLILEQVCFNIFFLLFLIIQLFIHTFSLLAKNRGFAFVEFADPDDAEHALDNMNNAEFYGKVLRINYARQYGVTTGTASMFNSIFLFGSFILILFFLFFCSYSLGYRRISSKRNGS